MLGQLLSVNEPLMCIQLDLLGHTAIRIRETTIACTTLSNCAIPDKTEPSCQGGHAPIPAQRLVYPCPSITSTYFIATTGANYLPCQMPLTPQPGTRFEALLHQGFSSLGEGRMVHAYCMLVISRLRQKAIHL